MCEAKADAQPLPANRTQSLPSEKRMASEEPEPTHDAKRIKTSATTRRIAFPEKPAVLEERNGEIEFRVVINNDGSRDSTIILTGLKCLFQKQQPKMPKDYIARLVYDRTHLSIAIVKMPLEVIEGITFREFRDRYGAHLMAHLKDYDISKNKVSPKRSLLTSLSGWGTSRITKGVHLCNAP